MFAILIESILRIFNLQFSIVDRTFTPEEMMRGTSSISPFQIFLIEKVKLISAQYLQGIFLAGIFH